MQHTLGALPVLEHLHGGERSATGDQLVAELALVLVLVLVALVLVVDLVILLLTFAEAEHDDGLRGW